MNTIFCFLAAAGSTAAKAGSKAAAPEPLIDWTDKKTQLIGAIIGVILLVIVVKLLIELYHKVGPMMPIFGSIAMVGLGIFMFQMIYNGTEPDWATPVADALRLFLPRKSDANVTY